VTLLINKFDLLLIYYDLLLIFSKTKSSNGLSEGLDQQVIKNIFC